ncbi:MAG: Bug family tripartite tricarboxylate transporter substrate binding protein [Pigmentiphaga sp.]|nr:Bug family tripartite tricarboxylate transporter substrate binding protein [Pigmentiphaga sp.]
MRNIRSIRHAVLTSLIAGTLLTTSSIAVAQAVERASIVVGLAAGGATDAAARGLAEKMRGTYGKSVVVENKTGAGARIAIQHTKDAAPDGTTLLLTPASMMAIYPHTYSPLGYDPVEDFVPVGMLSISEIGYGIGPSVPESIQTLEQYREWIKTNPNAATFAHGATGSGPHLLGELLGRLSGVSMVQTGYRGSQPAILDLMGGHVPAVAAPLGEFLPHVSTGKIRMLGVTGDQRSKFLPNVPTFKEQNVPLSEMTEWFGVFMPAGTPQQLVEQANLSLKAATEDSKLVNSLALMGMEPMWSTPADLQARLQRDIARWRDVIKEVGFTAQP